MQFKAQENVNDTLQLGTSPPVSQRRNEKLMRRAKEAHRWMLLHLSVAMIVVLGGCGGTNNTKLQNPSAPPTSAVSIAFQPAPTGSISLAGKTPITAVVSNDPSDAGVDWSLLCQNNGNCGTLTPLHTASGAATTYTPPQTISGNSQPFTVEAFATADHSKNVVTIISVTGFASNLKGTYVFETTGEDANGAYQLAGVIVLDGNGNVTSGEQTHNDPTISVSDPITGGSYYIGPDGRGTLTLNTADQNIGQQGIENLSLVLVSSSHALIQTLDNPSPLLAASNEISSGTLDLQTSKAAPTGGYAFVANGVDSSNASMALGGVLNIDSPNTISGAGSVADQDDSLTGTVTRGAPVSGTLTTPDSFGALKFNLSGFASSLQFTGYIVDTMHIKLIESDNRGSGTGFGTTAGVAISQGAATGTFLNNGSFAGTYVFNVVGQDLIGIPNTLASVGQFTADGSGNLNGFNDEVLSAVAVSISDLFTGTYALDTNGTGRVDSTINFSSNGTGPELIFYLTGNGNPPLVLDADANSSSLGIGSIGVGLAHPQAAPPFSLSGDYGFEFTQSNSATQNTATGQVTANPTSDTLTGFVDMNLQFSGNPNTKLSGGFGTIPNSGRFTGTLTNTFFPTPTTPANTISVAFYPVDPSLILFIETDFALSAQSTVGYFTTRTPVCPQCP
jgi:hypothetical protein